MLTPRPYSLMPFNHSHTLLFFFFFFFFASAQWNTILLILIENIYRYSFIRSPIEWMQWDNTVLLSMFEYDLHTRHIHIQLNAAMFYNFDTLFIYLRGHCSCVCALCSVQCAWGTWIWCTHASSRMTVNEIQVNRDFCFEIFYSIKKHILFIPLNVYKIIADADNMIFMLSASSPSWT